MACIFLILYHLSFFSQHRKMRRKEKEGKNQEKEEKRKQKETSSTLNTCLTRPNLINVCVRNDSPVPRLLFQVSLVFLEAMTFLSGLNVMLFSFGDGLLYSNKQPVIQ